MKLKLERRKEDFSVKFLLLLLLLPLLHLLPPYWSCVAKGSVREKGGGSLEKRRELGACNYLYMRRETEIKSKSKLIN